MRHGLLSYFPPPKFLAMPAVGIDVSDHSVKFLEFVKSHHGLSIGRYGDVPLPEGVVVSGKVVKPEGLVAALKDLRTKYKLTFVHATLPEEDGYLFEMDVPRGRRSEVRSAIEFKLEENVPLAPSEAVFDYDMITRHGKGNRSNNAVVAVFPRVGVDMYAGLFKDAGLMPLSLELEPQAVVRAVVPRGTQKTVAVLDFGRNRSGLSIAHGRTVLFAVTLDVGGEELTEMFNRAFPDLTPQERTNVKNMEGLNALAQKEEIRAQAVEVLKKVARGMSQYITYWNAREDVARREWGVASVLLCGGNANLGGLAEYLASELKLPVSRANVWVNALAIETHVPEISFNESLGYATAIGLALGSIH